MPTTDPATWQNPGLIASNSLVSSLAASGIFKGDWANVAYFATVTISLKIENNGVLNLDFTTDESDDVQQISDSYPLTPGEYTFSVRRKLKYFRVRFVNNGLAQNSFVIQCFADDGRNVDDVKDVNISGADGVLVDTMSKNKVNRLQVSDAQAANTLRCISDKLDKLLDKIDLFFN